MAGSIAAVVLCGARDLNEAQFRSGKCTTNILETDLLQGTQHAKVFTSSFLQRIFCSNIDHYFLLGHHLPQKTTEGRPSHVTCDLRHNHDLKEVLGPDSNSTPTKYNASHFIASVCPRVDTHFTSSSHPNCNPHHGRRGNRGWSCSSWRLCTGVSLVPCGPVRL